MRRGGLVAGLAVAAAAGGCSAPPYRDDPKLNGAIVEAQSVEAADNAIVREHTVYPHHFIEGTARLNSLGERDVNVLAAAYGRDGGTIDVGRGGAPSGLYAARCEAVIAQLAEAGVGPGRIVLADGLPGGDGIASVQVLVILAGEREAAEQPSAYNAREQADLNVLDNLLGRDGGQ